MSFSPGKYCERYGLDSRLYAVWLGMRQRCWNSNDKRYARYGGRGIRICRAWDTFERFAADVGPHPGKGWLFDRTNNDGNYEPNNVRWVSPTISTRNKSGWVKLSPSLVRQIRKRYRFGNGRILAKQFGVSHPTIMDVVKRRSWIEI